MWSHPDRNDIRDAFCGAVVGGWQKILGVLDVSGRHTYTLNPIELLFFDSVIPRAGGRTKTTIKTPRSTKKRDRAFLFRFFFM